MPKLPQTQWGGVDVKSGAGHYVVRPQSIRPDGRTYTDRLGRLDVTTLTPFREVEFHGDVHQQENTAPHGGPLLEPGNRHHFLLGRAIAELAFCSSEEELRGVLIDVRDSKCACPSEVKNDEVRGISEWAFRLHRSGELTAASGGHFRIPRHFARALQPDTTALSLYAMLCNQHGHVGGKTFGMNHAAMVNAKLTNMSERAFAKAVKKLRHVDAIEVAQKHRARVSGAGSTACWGPPVA